MRIVSPAPQQRGRIDWSEIRESEHFVQFYESEQFLVASIASFIGSGICSGDRSIVIATPEHREAMEAHLADIGLNLANARARGFYLPLDAAETLEKFMVNGQPDERLFLSAVGSVVARAAEDGRCRVRAFGEMVALLWAEGNQSGAIRLEELWNKLAKKHSFSLFCAYPVSGFGGAPNPLIHVCSEHSRVIPGDGELRADLQLR